MACHPGLVEDQLSLLVKMAGDELIFSIRLRVMAKMERCGLLRSFAQFQRMVFLRCLGLAGVFLLIGCSRPATTTTPDATPLAGNQIPTVGDWVVQQIGADPDTLNLITNQDDTGHMIAYPNICESLLFQNRTTLKLEPMLAESYEISPDQMIYTFHLRHGVKWQDGQPFTADDVKFSYDRIQDPAVDAAPLRLYFGNIKSCEVLDPYTVRFTATKRYFKTLECLGTDNLPILPRHLFAGSSATFNRSPYGRSPIGTGPYKFVRWDTGSQVVLERNDAYWGSSNHYPKRLVYEVIQEPSVSAQLLKKGEIDVVDGMAPIQWERELAHSRSVSRIQKIVYPFPAYSYLGFNLRLPLFSDVRVRHAIDLLLPRQEILSQIFLNQYAGECSGYDPPSSPNYNHDVAPTPEDPALALQLLNEAGWKNDHGDGLLYKDNQPLSFSVLYRSGSAGTEKMVELMQEALRRDGIDMKLERLEGLQIYERMEDWKFETAIGGWALDINGDPYQLWHSSQADIKKSSDFIGFKDPAADKLIEAGRLEYDDGKRAAIYRQLHRVIHDDYPVCFLFNPHVILLVSKRFQDVKIFAPRPCFDITSWWVPPALQKYR
jgi:peptide/nickel transport system substrate-binding protein